MKRGQRHDLGNLGSSVHVGTWMDAPGEAHTILLGSKVTGPRVIVHVWHSDADHLPGPLADPVEHADGEATVRLVRGDAWRDPARFEELYAENLGVASTEEIVAAIGRARSVLA